MKSWTTAVCAILAGGIVVFTVASLVASWKADRAQSGWSRTLGTREEILRRFPQRAANPSALRLKALAAPLGIELAPRNLEGRVRPTSESWERFEKIRNEMTESQIRDRFQRAT